MLSAENGTKSNDFASSSPLEYAQSKNLKGILTFSGLVGLVWIKMKVAAEIGQAFGSAWLVNTMLKPGVPFQSALPAAAKLSADG